MGRDKAGVALAGRPLLEHMLRKLRALGLRARVAGLRAPVRNVAADVLYDAHPDCGPLSGMETALATSEAVLVLVLGVDLPLVGTEFLGWMLRRAATSEAMATIPRLLGEPQPLCAVYRREVLGAVRESLHRGEQKAGDYKVMHAVEHVAADDRVDCFDTERVAATGAWCSTVATHWQFMNCNTPEDLTIAERFLAPRPML